MSTARVVARDEVESLVGKIERRLEPRGQIEQRRIDAANRRRQRALELIHRRARLKRRDRVDEIGDRLRLHEIDPAVEVRAQRELAGLGEPRARAHRELDDALEQHRAAVPADLDDVVARVGMRRLETT